MASNTPHLGLLKKDATADANDTFNIETMLNQNWDKIDTGFKSVDEKVKNIDFSSLASKEDLTTHNNVTATTAKKGHVQLSSTVGASETVAITPKGVSDAIQAVNATVAKKADQTAVDTALAKKADQASVVSSLATKADQTTVTEISNALATKAEQTTVNAVSGKVGTLEGLALQIQNGGRLGDYCQTISDWNHATKNGFYMAAGAANAPNTDWFFGQITSHNDTWIEQRVIAFSSSKHEYKRYNNAGVWSGWQRVTPGNLDLLQFGSKNDIVTSMNELFQYADNGKRAVRNAVIGKGVWVPENPSFDQVAAGVNAIIPSPLADAGWFKGTNEWYQNPQESPYGAGFPGVGELNGKIYVAAGQNTSRFLCYDTRTDTWTQLANLPVSYYDINVNATVLGNYIHLVGGANSTSINSGNNGHYRYDTNTNTWSQLAPYPLYAYHQSIVANNGYIYGIGGEGGYNTYASVFRYDINTNAWTQLKDFMEKVINLTTFSYGGFVFAQNYKGLLRFTWDASWDLYVGNHRGARVIPSIAMYGSQAIGIGGEQSASSRYVDIFDFNTGGWRSVKDSFNGYIKGHGDKAVIANGRLYAFNGKMLECYLI